ncbi:hypothetical protein EV361DRAFT_967000 [Lentinula raphanica]|uniref:Uncharacterized protein n=1 Tax=Lentinula raphanica TaxID=153919 RepID=A0AA38UER9_9AGAR|nr:hypothetical protein C8R42DRAFT_479563 [Lentinula raphanica]KAJ3757754.1 hypothetical protein EV360DRAFT_45390 [Lentinula raphanica]KAJ3824351.1 hypothetical protein F5880DRAFT_1560557 [Lentinula raphanica]KAJ3838889.1 hypothetical protein F5878DRAFT_618162 [Lentinula raphanica]KAJ3965144.1 hypothetical protein EV361DRAFT_967000 [Lentinula raphanica]
MSSASVDSADFSMSQLSLNSNSSQSEDWDRSLVMNEGDVSNDAKTPRNSVAFPTDGEVHATPTGPIGTKGKRSLSELLRLHAEKGTECRFSPEEAARVAEVLGQWINAASSPYEDEDDFFSKGSQDDMSLPKRSPSALSDSRPRGQSESANSRPPSSAGKRS